MSRFIYSVQTKRGDSRSGSLDAVSEAEAVRKLEGKGFFVLSIYAQEGWTAAQRSTKGLFGSGVGQRDLIFFGEQMSSLLEGGVPLVRSLSVLSEHSDNRALGGILWDLTQRIARGATLHDAIAAHPDCFDNLWVSLTHVGEVSGQLPRTIRQLTAHLRHQEELKGKVITALAYPTILLGMTACVAMYFFIKIVPVFSELFAGFDIEVPPLTLAIITVSNFLSENPEMIFLWCVGLGFIAMGIWKTENGQYMKERMLLRVPFIGGFYRNVVIERILTTLTTLLGSGVSVLNAFAAVERTVPTDGYFARALKRASQLITQGESIHKALRVSGAFPPLMVEMTLIGEESGKLPDIIGTLAIFYRQKVEQFVRRLTAVIEPILAVFVGVIVGFVVMSIFMPIFSISTMGSG